MVCPLNTVFCGVEYIPWLACLQDPARTEQLSWPPSAPLLGFSAAHRASDMTMMIDDGRSRPTARRVFSDCNYAFGRIPLDDRLPPNSRRRFYSSLDDPLRNCAATESKTIFLPLYLFVWLPIFRLKWSHFGQVIGGYFQFGNIWHHQEFFVE